MGGEGSGRYKDPVKQHIEARNPIATATTPVFLPDYSGVNPSVVKSNSFSTLVSGAVVYINSDKKMTGDTTKIVLGATGNVGIGTDSPSSLFTINSSTFNASAIALNNTFNHASNRNWAIALNQYEYGDFHIIQSNAQNGNPISAGTSRFVIENTGNIGIGTTNPAYAKIEVGTTTTLGSNALLAFSAIDGTYNPRVIISHVTASNDHYLDFNSSYSNGSGFADWVFRNGKIGIDTITPAEKLHISGGNLIITNNNIIKWYDSTGTARNVLYYDSADNVYISGRPGATDVYCGLSNGIVAKSTGNVGVGMATPDVRLSVNGALSMANTSSPTLTLTSSSGALFVSGGALHFKGSTGTVTKIANA